MRQILQSIYKVKIFKRIVPSLLKIYIRIFNVSEVVVENNQIKLYLNLKNPIDREIYLTGNYEKNQIDFLSEQIEKYKIKFFLDIGAHLGFYSINLSKKKISIISFEPSKKNFDQLKKNKDLNNSNNISIYNLALSNEKKKIKMWVPNKDKTGGFSVYDENDEELRKYNEEKTYKIESKSDLGDNIVKLENQKVAIKIDVERHEKKVLIGMPNILTNNDIVMQIELFDDRKKEIFEYLKNNKYRLFYSIKRDYYFKNF